ncbi:hypothetical protein K438DRAFT_681866 [Mycena galopus ATCC 62051]|nr:hypothetical protein K438DRAFT_681866 [Mycena galopus ATCC 62051]
MRRASFTLRHRLLPISNWALFTSLSAKSAPTRGISSVFRNRPLLDECPPHSGDILDSSVRVFAGKREQSTGLGRAFNAVDLRVLPVVVVICCRDLEMLILCVCSYIFYIRPHQGPSQDEEGL